MSGRNLLLQRVLGVLYVLAGLAKFVPGIESVEGRLDAAADANEGLAVLGPLSDRLAAHPSAVAALVGVAMAASGAVLVADCDRRLVVAALWAQLAMLACFVAVLVTSVPQILLFDAAFVAAGGRLLLVHARVHTRRTPE
ncbi:DUF6041 domain-containing protein [Streptomyces sp. AN091965]|uniref:DUF6041 domain-containing protein n=1 Tax=Streptomyces sp. AN091965 TaxID=2927803 RepID=UPI001F60CAFA|nr:DUF6041 domain-containing protein [Streptomyces sp. AN091965]MCI3934235.1 DUF6041 domain-containing protein [Streptomyces sp. AN091965]